MKSKVVMSVGSGIATILCLILFVGIAAWLYASPAHNTWVLFGYLLTVCIVLIVALFYSPMSIEVGDEGIVILRSFWFKKIPYSHIESIELMQPTMGEKRICGSGGFLGYWGWFSERDLGKYFAYYGKASDCFFVRLKSGKQYMLGCRNPKAVVDVVREKLGE